MPLVGLRKEREEGFRKVASSSVLDYQWSTGQRHQAVPYVFEGLPEVVESYLLLYLIDQHRSNILDRLKGEDSLSYLLEILDEFRGKLIVHIQGSSQSCCSSGYTYSYTQGCQKGMTWITYLSCCAAINLVMGIGKGYSPGTTPNLEERNTRV